MVSMSPLICDHCGAEDYDPQNQNSECIVCHVGHMRDDLSTEEINELNMKSSLKAMEDNWYKDNV